MTKLYIQQQNGGFALILALLVSSVALAIGLSLLDVTVKQLGLSSTVRESEIAFQAAAAGMNCLQTARNRYVYETQENEASSAAFEDMECLGKQIDMTDNDTDTRVQKFSSQITWETASGADLCVQMEMIVLNATISANPPDPITPVGAETALNGTNTKSCAVGNICTFGYSRGYNRSCTDVASGAIYTVQREITAEF